MYAQDTQLQTRVCEIVADVLTLPPDAITPQSNLYEMGAQSLEFIDIVFRLEQEWDIEITRGEVERAARGEMTDEEFAPKGIISEAGLARLRELMPEAADRVQPGLRAEHILTLFTAQTFANLVAAKRTPP